MKAESFARAAIEIKSNERHLKLCHVPEGLALWEPFPDESVRVLVSASLLWTVRVGEKYFAFEQFLDRLVVTELSPVINRDGVNGEPLERNRHDVGDRPWAQGAQLPNDNIARQPIHQREEAMTRIVLGTVHEIGFPVSDASLA